MTGGQGVAPPHRRIAQERDRQQRMGHAPLFLDEPDEAEQRNGGQGGDWRQQTGLHALRLIERQQERDDEGDEQEQAQGVEAPGLLAIGAGLEARGEQDGEQAQGHVDQEDAAPAQVLGQITAHDRTEGARGHHHGGKIALVACALARGNGLADHRLRERHQATAAQALQDAADGQ